MKNVIIIVFLLCAKSINSQSNCIPIQIVEQMTELQDSVFDQTKRVFDSEENEINSDKEIVLKPNKIIDLCNSIIHDNYDCSKVGSISVLGYFNNHSNIHAYIFSIEYENGKYYTFKYDLINNEIKFLGEMNDNFFVRLANYLIPTCKDFFSKDFIVHIYFNKENIYLYKYGVNLPLVKLNIISLLKLALFDKL